MLIMSSLRVLMICCLSLLFCCKQAKTEKKQKTKSVNVALEMLWETDTVFKTCEAVRYDAGKKVIYVSNIGNVPPDAKDNDGSISMLSKDGQVLNQNWVNDISAPKGSGIFKNTLYVTNIDEVIAINISSGQIDNRYEVDNALFLNDLDVDNNGDVYFTDSRGSKIYKLINDEVVLWLDLPEINPNGILVEQEHIIVVSYSNGDFISIDKQTKEKEVIATGILGGDGIVPIHEGYLVSTWPGEIFFVDKHRVGSNAVKILDTKDEKLNAADMSIIPEEYVLLVPTFFGNRIIAYKIKVDHTEI